IIMVDLPPPNNAADLPEDEPVHPEPAPVIHDPAPVEEIDEDEMEVDDDAEVINQYEEVDPLNRSPLGSDEESEFAPQAIPIVDANLKPIPPIGVTWRLFIETLELWIDRCTIALDMAMREQKSDHSEMRQLVESLSRRFNEFQNGKIYKEIEALREELRETMEGAEFFRTDGATTTARDDDGDDTTASIDPQPSEIMPPKRMFAVVIQKLVADKVAEALAVDRVIKPCHLFEKIESTFRISDCAEKNNVMFAAATLQGRALTWWNLQVAMLSFNELVLLFPDVVPSEKKNVEPYIKGLPENIKRETTYSKTLVLSDVVQRAHTLMEQKVQAKAERVAEGNKRKEEKLQTVTTADHVNLEIVCPSALSVENLAIKQEIAEENLAIEPVMSVGTETIIEASTQIETTSKVEMLLVERMQLEMPSRAKGQTLLRVVHILVNNKMLVVKGNSGVSRLKVISCIKARKYIERGCKLFLAQVTKKELTKRRLEDVLVIRDFPKVFPDDLPRLPPPRQVELRIELMPGASLVAHAPYRLAPSKMKELSDQLKELSEKEFILLSSSSWGAQKNKKYECGEEEEEAFQMLKQKLCSAPILALPEGTEDFVVYCDASVKGVKAVFMQREKVITYASWKLNKHEENYTTHDLELGIALEGRDRFVKHGNSSPRYIGPFKIIDRIGPVAYKLELPDELHGIHKIPFTFPTSRDA
nr:reverse transcriptase domain-containing protein [Tanacetum cinerariifolium]